MRAMLFGGLGLVLGAATGFWFGLMGGLIYAEAANVSCHEGYCGTLAVSVAGAGAMGLGIAGAIIGVRRAFRRPTGAALPDRALISETARHSRA